MTSRDGHPFPRRPGKLGETEVIGKGVPGTLQDNTIVFEQDGKEGFFLLNKLLK